MNFFSKFYFIIYLGSLFISQENLHADIDDGKELELILSREPLFVSLGAACEPALMLKFSGYRKAAFPLDWVSTFDKHLLVELLNNDFQDFFSPDYLKTFGTGGHLLNTRYEMEFIHDGNFKTRYSKRISVFKEKYERRIARFRSLNAYPGKVFFIRSVCITTIEEPRFYHPKEDAEMSEVDAITLYNTLKDFFPLLNFELVIINCCNSGSLQEEIRLGDAIRIYKADPYFPLLGRIKNYTDLFTKLADTQ